MKKLLVLLCVGSMACANIEFDKLECVESLYRLFKEAGDDVHAQQKAAQKIAKVLRECRELLGDDEQQLGTARNYAQMKQYDEPTEEEKAQARVAVGVLNKVLQRGGLEKHLDYELASGFGKAVIDMSRFKDDHPVLLAGCTAGVVVAVIGGVVVLIALDGSHPTPELLH